MDHVEEFEFVGALLRFALAVQHAHSEIAREHGTTPQQAMLLCAVSEEPQSMVELAGKLQIEKSTLTGLVDRAEKRGLVTRVPATCDRRMIGIVATPAAAELMHGFHEAVAKALLDQIAELPAGVQRQLHTAIPPAADLFWERLGWARLRDLLLVGVTEAQGDRHGCPKVAEAGDPGL